MNNENQGFDYDSIIDISDYIYLDSRRYDNSSKEEG